MAKNVLQIRFKQVSPDAKKDISNITAIDIMPFSELDDLRMDGITPPGNFATPEWNHNVLDDSMEEFPDNPKGLTWGLFSKYMSDGFGNFYTPPELRISFRGQHRSPGLTFYFNPYTNDYASKIHVSWYRDIHGVSLITEGEYTLDGNISHINQNVEGYRHIRIKFLSTNHPYRFVKMWAVEFGVTRLIYDEEIDECNILEEIDATSRSVSVNMLRSRIKTLNSVFSPLTSPDFNEMMMQNQQLHIYRNEEPYGIFFMETWEDATQRGIIFDIVAGDAIFMMEKFEFVGGLYVDKPVTELLDEIFFICFPTRNIIYELDPELRDAVVTGYIPITDCATALQHIAFALNATVDTSRTGNVSFYRREVEAKGDGIPSSNNEQPWASAANLQTNQKPSFYPSLEPNYTLADGELEEFPDDVTGLNLGWISETMSDENGLFNDPPEVTIRFNTSHIFRKINILFGPYEDEYIEEFAATFYDEHGEVIKYDIYTFTQNPAVWEDYVPGYRRIDIKVLKTSHPHRFARIAFFEYGKSYFVPLERQYHGGRDRPTELVTGVEVVSYNYVPGTEDREMFRGELPVGRHEIRFIQPLHSLTVTTGATIVERHVNYAVLNVTNPNIEIILTGKVYLPNELIHSVHAEIIAGARGNTERYEDYTLVSRREGQFLAETLYDYFQKRIYSTVNCVLDDLQVGYVVEVETFGRSISAIIQTLDVNLRANRAIMEVRGYAMA